MTRGGADRRRGLFDAASSHAAGSPRRFSIIAGWVVWAALPLLPYAALKRTSCVKVTG
jgi:hypothetical protein